MPGGCPQCGSFNFEKSDSRSNYNMVKGMVGQAVAGNLGSLAGFENQTIWECTTCGCRFVEGINNNKIISQGYKPHDTYYDVGLKDVTVTGTNGYKYVVTGIHLDVYKNDVRQNHFEIPTFEIVEYQLNSPLLIVNYLCKDGRVRRKKYTDLSEKDLKILINAMQKSLKNFQKNKNYDFLMHNNKIATIVELKQGQKTYKDSWILYLCIVSGILSLILGLIIGIGASDLTAFFVVFVISFPISFISLLVMSKKQ